MTDRRANYALVQFQDHLGRDEEGLAVPWAEFVGDATAPREFEATTDDPTEVHLQLQAYDIDEFGHEIVINGTPLSGFDIPPAEGWQCWMDAITDVDLVEGTNTIRVERDPETTDSFVVGVVTVYWKEPVA